jgi:general L-amino acid transport system permease protein
VRGGLQAIPRQQEEAAKALGHSYWQRTWYVILPQAVRIAIPPVVIRLSAFSKTLPLS